MDESTIRIRCQNCKAHTIASITPGPFRSVACSGCGTRLVEFEALRGFIYVLTHPQMPSLVKIGFTTRPVEERVAELSAATSVPGPFVIEAVFPSSEPEQHELAAHGKLAAVRVESKEFFRVDLIEAINAVSAICGPASYLRTPGPSEKQPAKEKGPVQHTAPPAGALRRAGRETLSEWQERMYRK